MTEINDKLLREFLAPARREIANDGFSRRVMRRLPDNAPVKLRARRLNRLWTALCCALALGLFIHLDGFRLIFYSLREIFYSTTESAVGLDPLSLLIAVVVLTVLACRKIVTLA